MFFVRVFCFVVHFTRVLWVLFFSRVVQWTIPHKIMSILTFVQLQASNGHRKFHNTTTSLSIPSTEDEMIDITPRETNYSSTMAGNENYGRQPGSPTHGSSAYARDRELNDAEGKNINGALLHPSISPGWMSLQNSQYSHGALFALSFEVCTTLSFICLFLFHIFLFVSFSLVIHSTHSWFMSFDKLHFPNSLHKICRR